MKKAASMILAAALCLGCSVSAFADSYDQDNTAGAGTQISYTYANDPTYTVTIPASVEISKEGTPIAIVASDVENLGDKAISVTVEGTDSYRNQFLLNSTTSNASMRFSITLPDGTVLETTGGKDQHVGAELLRFTGNGSQSLSFAPIEVGNTKVGEEYSGTLTYGIALV